MSSTFASLSVPNYRTYFIGVTTSNIGQWMSRTAISWLVLIDLTGGNARALGWVTSLMFIPSLLLAPVAGTIADRFPKRRVMTAAQLAMAFSSLTMAALVLTGQIRLWHVFALTLFDGISGAFDGPARQSMVSEVVPAELLPNAISLNSASFNMARLVGPGIAGFLIALFGTGPVIAINVLTYLAMIACLLLMRGDQLRTTRVRRGQGGMRDGLRYIRGRADLMVLLSIAFVVGSFGFNFAISNAVMATQAFSKGSGEYGLLGTWMGIGALTAALTAARRRPRLRYVLGSMLAFSLLMVASSLSPTYGLFAALMVPIGFFSVTTLITANALVQTTVSPEVRGRVMSVWGAVLLGGTPIVSPVVGWLGDVWGPRWTVLAPSIPMLVTWFIITAWIMRHDHLRVVIDRTKRAPWLRIVRPTAGRGALTEDMPNPVR